LVNLPKFNVAPDALPENALATKRTVTKTVRIDEELERRIEDILHDPRSGFGGHYTALAIWSLEQCVYAYAKVASDPKFRALARVYRERQDRLTMQQHLLNINEMVSKDAAILGQWIMADDTDGGLTYLEEMVGILDQVPLGKWYKLIARKINDNESVTHTLEAANAGTPKQQQRAKAITDVLEAATGQ
jgi:hypothetical protein